MKRLWAEDYKEKVIEPALLPQRVAALRREGKTIATLNGSFDLLHAGHLHIIYEASKVADTLILALNSDKSIQMYKSPSRPIIALEYRLQMISALQFVSHVTWFEEINPCAILSIIKPDVHVNGAEYGENCVEAETVKRHGGRVHIVGLVPGLSTSQVIQKIASLPACVS